MVFGTSKMLQMTGPPDPSEEVPSLRRKLFDAFRVMEIHRTILYGDNSFLSQGVWPIYQKSVEWKKAQTPDFLETVLSSMMRASSFSTWYGP